jgi:hypothetical protein
MGTTGTRRLVLWSGLRKEEGVECELNRRIGYRPAQLRKALGNVLSPDVGQMIHLCYASAHGESSDTCKLWSL